MHLRERRVVVADDGDVDRNPQAGVLGGVERADRTEVVCCEDRRRHTFRREEPSGGD